MNDDFGLDEDERKLCSGGESSFFTACLESFGFLVKEHGFRVWLRHLGRGCYEARFTLETETEFFYVRLFHDFNDLWCDVERFAGLDKQSKLRFGDAIELLGLSFPVEHLDVVLPNEQAIPSRIWAFADCIREHLMDFRNIPLGPNPRRMS